MRTISCVSRRRFLTAAAAATVLSGELMAPAWRRLHAARDSGRIGLSLNIGLNIVDNAGFYQGGAAPLAGCRNDAHAMADIAKSNGFEEPLILLDQKATHREVRRHIVWAAHHLRAGDTFLCTMSSHGVGIEDQNADESDQQDEAWCLYDNVLLDDEFFHWCEGIGPGKGFKPGVRVIVVIDACHSGSATKVLQLKRGIERGDIQLPNIPRDSALRKLDLNLSRSRSRSMSAPALVKALPDEVAGEISRREAKRFAERSRRLRGDVSSQRQLKADALLLAACQDDELASDGAQNGLFTYGLLQALRRNPRDYAELFTGIQQQLRNSQQRPNYDSFGSDGGLAGTSPFTL